jgi:hypothetical protein
MAGSSVVTIDVPSDNSLAQLVVSTPSPADVLSPPDPSLSVLPGTAVEIDASDTSGQTVNQFSSPMTVTISFRPPPGVDPLASHLYALGPTGQIQDLSGTVVALGHDSYSITATTSQLAQFAVCAPSLPAMQARVFLPIAINVASRSGW